MQKGLVAGLLAAALTAAPASAQDAFMSPMDFSTQSQALTSSVIGGLSVGETARQQHSARVSRSTRPGRGDGVSGFVPGGRISNALFPYASTAASQKQALDAYIARAARKSPQAARVLTTELRSRNIAGEMQREMRKYGLDAGDAADMMTVFLVTGHEALTGADATAAQMQGVRRQAAAQLEGISALRNPATRTGFAEELKIITYIVAASGGSARRDGHVAQYRQGVTTLYRQITGQNIGGWRLTPAGFAS